MKLGETGCEFVDLTELADDRDQWQAFVDTVTHVQYSGIFLAD
jgi:hypothetical protein